MLLDPSSSTPGTADAPWHLPTTRPFTLQAVGAMVAGLGSILSMQTRSRGSASFFPASAGFVASFYGTLGGRKDGRADQLPPGRTRDRPIIRDSGIDTSQPLRRSRQMAPFASSGLKVIDIAALPSPPSGMPHAQATDAGGERSGRPPCTPSGTSGLPQRRSKLTYGNSTATSAPR